MCVWKPVKSKLESSLIWHTSAHQDNFNTSDDTGLYVGASVKVGSSSNFRKCNSRSKWTWHFINTAKLEMLLLQFCTRQNNITSRQSFNIFFWETKILPFWSGSNLLKLACSSALYPTATRHSNPCRILMAWTWKRTATGEKKANKMERRWQLEITLETHHGAHASLMQTVVLQENTEIWECFCND